MKSVIKKKYNFESKKKQSPNRAPRKTFRPPASPATRDPVKFHSSEKTQNPQITRSRVGTGKCRRVLQRQRKKKKKALTKSFMLSGGWSWWWWLVCGCCCALGCEKLFVPFGAARRAFIGGGRGPETLPPVPEDLENPRGGGSRVAIASQSSCSQSGGTPFTGPSYSLA